MTELSFFKFEEYYIYIVSMVCAVLALVFALLNRRYLSNLDPGTPSMKAIGDQIAKGARSFLDEEYKYIAVFVVLIAIILCLILYDDDNLFKGVNSAVCFLIGALLSGIAGYAGMLTATMANVLTCKACTKSLDAGLKVAFTSGTVMGLTVVGLGLLGLSSVAAVFFFLLSEADKYETSFEYIAGFGFGASSIALFARVGGGTYTKAADVGSDLVGKVEANIPEDHPNNPGVIADNVGDNVGDVAGMGADLFESYVGSIIAACTLATQVTLTEGQSRLPLYALPFWLAGAGIICSLIGMTIVGTNKDHVGGKVSDQLLEDLLWSINKGIYLAAFLFFICAGVICYLLLGNSQGYLWVWVFISCVIGLVAGILIGSFTEYCTSYTFMPTQSIALKSLTGPAPVIIQGLGVGMLGTAFPVFVIALTIIICFYIEGLYSIAIAAVGMLSTLGITLATDAYGPVADNAGGIAEMDPECSDEVRDRTDALDALGNTTAATGKGFAIGSAALTSVGLVAAFMNIALENITVEIKEPVFIVGVLIGSTLPFVFAALTMLSVGRAAEAIIVEIRMQFRKYPELKDIDKPLPDHIKPDATRCVQIATQASLLEMINPGLISVFVPIAVGFILTARALGGVLIGSLCTGFMLAITMSNAGGAWDNSKKWVEKGGLALKVKEITMDKNYDEKDYLKKSECHKATVVGDTVGDPFKDTSGPALNILIKLMSMVSLVCAPFIFKLNDTATVFGDVTSMVIGGVVLAVLIPLVIIVQCFVDDFYYKLNQDLSKVSDEHTKNMMKEI